MSKKLKSLEDINADFEKRSEFGDTKGKDKKAADKKGELTKRKKGAIIADAIFYMALVAIIVVIITFSKSNIEGLEIAGYRPFEVLTSSMKSVYPRGSIIIVKETLPKELTVGDDITFIRSDNSIVTHRIIEIKENHEGTRQRGFVTKGVDNDTADAEIVIESNVIGKVVKSFPKIGIILSLISENPLIVVIFFAALLGFSFSLKIFWRLRSE